MKKNIETLIFAFYKNSLPLVAMIIFILSNVGCSNDESDELIQEEEKNYPEFSISANNTYEDRISLFFSLFFEGDVEVTKFGVNYGIGDELNQNIEFAIDSLAEINNDTNPLLINDLASATNYKFEGYLIAEDSVVVSEIIEISTVAEGEVSILGGVRASLWPQSRISFTTENSGHVISWNSNSPVELYLSSFNLELDVWTEQIIDDAEFADFFLDGDGMISFSSEDRHFLGFGNSSDNRSLLNRSIFEIDLETAEVTEMPSFGGAEAEDFFSFEYEGLTYLIASSSNTICAYSFNVDNNVFESLGCTEVLSQGVVVPSLVDSKIYFLNESALNRKNYTQHIFDPASREFSVVDFLEPLPLLENVDIRNYFAIADGSSIYLGDLLEEDGSSTGNMNVYEFKHTSQTSTLLNSLPLPDTESVIGNIAASFIINGELHMLSDVSRRHFVLKIY